MTSPAPISHPTSGLLLSSPDTVLAAIPFLVGFTPTESVVIVWLGRREIQLTQRADLPSPGDVERWLDVVFGHAGVPSSEEIVVVAYSMTSDAADVVDKVLQRAEHCGLRVLDAMLTDGERWRSLRCTDPHCCGPEGKPIDPGALAAVGAEFTVRGVAPSQSRDDLVGELAVDREGRAEVTVALDERGAQLVVLLSDDPDGSRREGWRDDCIASAMAALASHAAQSHDPVDRVDCAVDLIQGLLDVRVRDTILWECTRLSKERLHTAHSAFAAAVTVAPPGHVAPVATCTAILAWLLGDGARASIAIERAAADDPNYSLAQLVWASVQGGLPPGTWRDAMSAVGRVQCRYGTQPSKKRRSKKRGEQQAL